MQEQKQNNDYIERRSVYDQSNKMKTIEGQYQQIQSQYGDGVQGLDDQLCQMLKKSQARLVQICCLCQEKGRDHQQLSEELFQYCDLDEMLIEKYCKECES